MTAETITGVAIIDKGGRVWALPEPNRHAHIFALAAFMGTTAEGNIKGQGFMTNKGRFVDRADGLALAKATGQVKDEARLGHQLYSEDLW